jgi:hypothetical protein
MFRAEAWCRTCWSAAWTNDVASQALFPGILEGSGKQYAKKASARCGHGHAVGNYLMTFPRYTCELLIRHEGLPRGDARLFFARQDNRRGKTRPRRICRSFPLQLQG